MPQPDLQAVIPALLLIRPGAGWTEDLIAEVFDHTAFRKSAAACHKLHHGVVFRQGNAVLLHHPHNLSQLLMAEVAVAPRLLRIVFQGHRNHKLIHNFLQRQGCRGSSRGCAQQ